MSDLDVRRAQGIIAGAAWIFGLIGFASSIERTPLSPEGSSVISLMALNQVGSLLAGVLAMIALFGVAIRTGDLVVGAGVGFAGAAVIQLVQLGRATNWFGGNASTVTFFATIALGLLILSFPPRQPGW